MSNSFSTVGKRLPRVDSIAKVKGEYTSIADIQLPGMLHTAILRSPHAHARIISIDTGEAEKLPGVKAILTHRNVPRVHPLDKLEFLLCDEMHFAGDEVAVVAAKTKTIARQALNFIKVKYEILPAVFDQEEAMKEDAPLVHPEHGSNIFHGQPKCTDDGWFRTSIGNTDKGFTEADYILEGVYESPAQYTCSPMTRAVVCQWTGDKLTCWADTQLPQLTWMDLARCLGIPHASIRLIVNCIGSYGCKVPEKVSILTALLAKKTGRPVKMELSREEDFITAARRLNYRTYGRVGIKKDGSITAIYNKAITNCGNDSQASLRILATSATKSFLIVYRSPNVRFEGCSVLTNTTQHGAMLGFGDPEANFCIDRLMDEAAEKINMDPAEFRIKNCIRYGDKGYEQARLMMGMDPQRGIAGNDIDMQKCVRTATEKAGWKKKWKGWKTPVSVKGSRRRGIGVAVGMHHCSYMPYSAVVKMNQDGTANVLSGGVEMGQGCATAIAQVVAESLDMDFADINVIMADTGVTPYGWGNTGSMGTSSAVTAAKLAADDTRQKLLDIAAKELGVKAARLQIKDRIIFVKGQPEKKISMASVCQKGVQVIGTGNNPPADTIKDKKTGQMIQFYAVACVVSEVEVDTETGELQIINVSSANDCGRAINPTIVENQIDLGITMGNGWIRSENFIIDESTGVMLNPNLLDYKLMTILDMPSQENMQKSIIEMPSAWGPYGAKGFSETAMVGVAPSIANAVYNAIGVRIRGERFTPDRILEALGKTPQRRSGR